MVGDDGDGKGEGGGQKKKGVGIEDGNGKLWSAVERGGRVRLQETYITVFIFILFITKLTRVSSKYQATSNALIAIFSVQYM
jgi:hypothetical protein